MKKIFKNTYIFAALIFLAGVFCMLPTKNNSSKVGDAASVASESVVRDEDISQFGGVSTRSSIVVEDGKYYISDAAGLAELAYNVNSGINSYEGKEVYLTANIDLSGKLWTPIGTETNPFKGNFLGQLHTISNIAITDESLWEGQTYSGLFGYVMSSNAAIYIRDLKIAGYFIAEVANSDYVGSFVGKGAKLGMLNCIDNTIKNSSTPSICSLTNGSLYRTGSFNGVSTDFDSQEEIDASLTLKTGSSVTYAYLASYSIWNNYSGADFYYFDGSGVEQTKYSEGIASYKVVRVPVSYDGNVFRANLPVGVFGTNSNIAGNIITSRENLIKSSTATTEAEFLAAVKNKIYVRYPGYNSNIPSIAFSNGLRCPIYFGAVNDITINFDYEYGNYDSGYTARTLQYTMKYDESFVNESAGFASNKVFERLGYNLNYFSNYQSTYASPSAYPTYAGQYSAFTEGATIISYKTFPIAGETYYFPLQKTLGKNVSYAGSSYINLRLASDEGGSFSTFNDVNNAVKDLSVSGSLTGYSGSITYDGDQAYPRFKFDYSSGEYYINITLAKGYKIESLFERIEETDAGDLKFINTQEKQSGVYFNFPNHSGTGSSYTITNKNNDDYGLVDGMKTKEEVDESTGETTYTIFVSNLVAGDGTNPADGQINIVIEREWVEVDITPVWGGLESDIDSINYKWTINSVAGDNNVEDLLSLAYIKRGESADKLYVSEVTGDSFDSGRITTSTTLFVRYDESINATFILQNNEFLAISGNNKTTDNAFSVMFENSFSTMKISHNQDNDDSTFEEDLNPRIAGRKSKVSIQFVNAEGALDSIDAADANKYFQGEDGKYYAKVDSGDILDYESYYYGIAIDVNGTGEMNNNVEAYVYANGVSGGVEAINNLYYRASQLEVQFLYNDSNGNAIETARYSLAQVRESVPNEFDTNVFTSIYDAGINKDTAYNIIVYVSKVKYNVLIDTITTNDGDFTTEEFEKLFSVRPTVFDAEDDQVFSYTQDGIWLAWDQQFKVKWILSTTGEYILNAGSFKFTRYSIEEDQYAQGTLVAQETGTAVVINAALTNASINQNFDVSTTINKVNARFDWQSLIVVVNSAIDEEKNAVDDAIESIISQSMHFTYEEDKDAIGLSQTVLNSINISTQYYLIGWYLQGANVTYTTSYSQPLTNSTFINYAKEAVNIAGHGSEYSKLQAVVGIRKAKVDYTPGTVDAGYGKLYASDKTSAAAVVTHGSYTYKQLAAGINLSSDIFYNVGHSFKEWTTSKGAISSGVYSITLGNFALLFGESGEVKTWTSFGSASTPVVEVTAQWEKIAYYVLIDGDTSTQSLKIKQTINLYYDWSLRNSQVEYTTDDSSFSAVGKQQLGYNAVGVKVAGNGQESDYSINEHGSGFMVVDLAFIQKFLPKDNWFSANTAATAITFDAIRENATYKMYIAPSTEGYYTLDVSQTLKDSWGAETGVAAWGGKDSNGIYFNITFDKTIYKDEAGNESVVLDNIKNALKKGDLILSRHFTVSVASLNGQASEVEAGFQCVGFVYNTYTCGDTVGSKYFININPAENDREFDYSDDTFAWDSESYVFDRTVDITLQPVWKYVNQKGILAVEFASADVAAANNGTGLYLATDKEILNIYYIVDGQRVSLTAGSIYANGLKFNGLSYTVGSKTENDTSINILDFDSTNGKVSVSLSMIDLAQPSNVATRQEVTDSVVEENVVKLVKNEYVLQSTTSSVYTGTKEFVSTGSESNTFFGIKYNWNGSLAQNYPTLLSDKFSSYEVEGDDFNVGLKNLKATAKATFTVDANLFSNASSSGVVTFANGVTVVAKEVPISFTSASTFSVSGNEIIVAENGSGAFASGSENFTYKFDKIVLLQSTIGKYIGAASYVVDSQNFKVCGLKVQYLDEDGNVVNEVAVTDDDGVVADPSNFTWNISTDSSFEIIEADQLLSLSFNMKRFYYSNRYYFVDFIQGNISLESLQIDGVEQEINNNSTQRFMIGQSLFVVVDGNDSENIRMYINSAVSASLSYRIKVTNNSGFLLFVLGMEEEGNWIQAGDKPYRKIAFAHETSTGAESFTQSYEKDLIPSGTKSYEIVLTQCLATRVYTNDDLNENGLWMTRVDPSEMANPWEDSQYNKGYEGMEFAGYQLLNNDGSIDTDNENENIRIDNAKNMAYFMKPGAGEETSLVTMWNLVEDEDKHIIQNQTSIKIPAAVGKYSIDFLESMFSYVQESVRPSKLDVKFALSTDISGVIIENNGTASTISVYNSAYSRYDTNAGLNGAYKVTVTFTFDDGIQGEQTFTAEYDLAVEVCTTKVGIRLENANGLIYNGRDHRANIDAVLYFIENEASSDYASGDVLSSVKLTSTSFTGGLVDISAQQMTNAGSFTATFSLSTYAGIYEIAAGETQTVSIGKYKIDEEVEEPLVKKSYGEAITAEDLVVNYTVADTSEVIEISFDGKEEGTAIGKYKLTNPTTTNTNYDVSDFVGYLEIDALKRIYLEIKTPLTYEYNGLAADKAELVYVTADGKYYLSLYNESTLLSKVEAWLGIDQTTAIGESERESYAAALEFTVTAGNKDASDLPYEFAVSVGTLAAAGWEEVGLTNASEEISYTITKRQIELSDITKVFDFDDIFDSSKTGHSVTISNVVDGESVVVEANFASNKVGEHVLSNVTLSDENYEIASIDEKGTILPSDEEVTIEIEKDEFDYGEILYNAEIMAIFNATVEADGKDLLEEYVSSISAVVTLANGNAISDVNKSTGGYLNAGDYKVVYTYSCPEFAKANETVEFEFTVKPLNIIVTNNPDRPISKVYDGNNTLLALGRVNETNGYYLSTGVLVGDVVEVARGSYSDKNVAAVKTITVYFTPVQGEKNKDEQNYNISTSVVGEIRKQSIILEKISEGQFIPDGAFVNDGKTLTLGENPTFDYPNTLTAATAMNAISKPTRPGYVFKGWKVQSGSGYIDLNEDNILSFLSSIGDDVNNTSKTASIYPVWEKAKFTILLEGFEIGDQVVEYYDTLEFTAQAGEGRKYTTFTYNLHFEDQITITSIKSTVVIIKLERVDENGRISCETAPIEITFNFLANDENGVAQNTTITKNVLELADVEIPELSTTEGTYTFKEWTYLVEGQPEKFTSAVSAVASLYQGQLYDDKTIDVTAQWEGVPYVVNFTADGGEVDGSNRMYIVYGGQIISLPSATGQGLTFNYWADENGNKYEVGDLFKTVGTDSDSDGVYEVSFNAVWGFNSYTLTLDTSGANYVASYKGKPLASSRTFDIVYASEGISIDITPFEGWGYTVVTDGEFLGEIDCNGNVITIKNLYDDEAVKIEAVAKENNVSIVVKDVEGVTAKINNVDAVVTQETDGVSIIAKTASKVVVSIAKKAGYIIDGITLVSGSASTVLEVKDDLTGFTLTGITKDVVINVATSPKQNKLNVGNLLNNLSDVTVQVKAEEGEAENEKVALTSASQYYVATGKTIILEGNIIYGYKNAVLSESGFVKANETNTEFDAVNYVYKYSVEISEFVDDFTLEFTKEAREFVFNLAVLEEDEENATINEEFATQTVLFGQQLNLDCVEMTRRYVLVAWVDGQGNTFASADLDKVTLDASMKNILESASEINLYADIDSNLVRIIIKTDDGALYVRQPGLTNAVFIGGGSEREIKLFPYEKTEIFMVPSAGFEFDRFVFFDEWLNEISFEDMEGSWNEAGNTINFTAVESWSGVQIFFKKQLHTISVQAGVKIMDSINMPSAVGGRIYLTDSNGNKLGDANYIKPQGLPDGDDYIGQNYFVQAYTRDVLYFVIEEEQGFEAQLEASAATVGNQFRTNDDGDVVLVYNISKFTTSFSIKAILVAITNTINVTLTTFEGYDDDGHVVLETANAGRVVIENSDFVAALTNSQSSVQGFVVAGRNFTFNARTRLGYRLYNGDYARVKYYIETADNSAYAVRESGASELDWVKIGYNQTTESITISNVLEDINIYIVVIPETYTVNLVDKSVKGESILATTTVTYNELLSLEGLPLEVLKPEPPEEKYAFNGYWTAEDSRGNQYVSSESVAINNWRETGYYYDGQNYVAQSNFIDGEFYIYVGWRLKKAEIYFNFFPEGVNKDYSFDVRQIVVNDEYDDVPEEEKVVLWTTQGNKWKVQVYWGSVLTIKAPEIIDYSFARVHVEHLGVSTYYSEGQVNTLDAVEDGIYQITLVYNPEFKIVVRNKDSVATNGGESWVEQDGVNLGSEGFIDWQRVVTVVARPNEGFNFLYWQNTLTGETYTPSVVEEGNYKIMFTDNMTSPLMLIAVFEGKPVKVAVDLDTLLRYHSLISISSNNLIVATAADGTFNARIGDEIVLTIRKSNGYTLAVNDENFILSTAGDKYTFTCILTTENTVLANDGSYSLDVGFAIEKEVINITVDKVLFDEGGSDITNEINRVGKLTFIEYSGNKHDVDKNAIFKTLYGDTTSIIVAPGVNYKIKQILLISGGESADITNRLIDGKLDLNVDLVDRYFSKNISIEVVYARMIWTDEEYRSSSLDGEGTEDNPFIIRTPQDMALVAYLVNNNLEINGVNARFAQYKVVKDLNFAGKYWQAIGTESFPFEGVMDLGAYRFDNVNHYQTYENPSASFSGLFWKISDEAQIIVDRSAIIIVCGTVGLVVVAGVIIIVAIFINKKKKKNMLR